jgi:hypothetical protein
MVCRDEPQLERFALLFRTRRKELDGEQSGRTQHNEHYRKEAVGRLVFLHDILLLQSRWPDPSMRRTDGQQKPAQPSN